METLSQIFHYEFRKEFFEEDFIAFIILKNRYEETGGDALSEDVLVALLISKTEEALSGFLRLHQDALGTFDQAVRLVSGYCRFLRSTSRQLVQSTPQHQLLRFIDSEQVSIEEDRKQRIRRLLDDVSGLGFTDRTLD